MPRREILTTQPASLGIAYNDGSRGLSINDDYAQPRNHPDYYSRLSYRQSAIASAIQIHNKDKPDEILQTAKLIYRFILYNHT